MVSATLTRSRYVIYLNSECEVFAARQIDHLTTDGALIERTSAPVGPFTEAGPDRCLACLVTADHLPESAGLGEWHAADEFADVVGYWTVGTA